MSTFKKGDFLEGNIGYEQDVWIPVEIMEIDEIKGVFKARDVDNDDIFDLSESELRKPNK